MKPPRKRNANATLPTRGELRLLQVLWEIGQGTVEEVMRWLPSRPPANYKTVQTLLRIMEQKEFVRHEPQGRAFVFSPRVSREEVGRRSVRHLLQQNFAGSPAEMLVHLLQGNRIEESELEELEALIRHHRTQQKAGP